MARDGERMRMVEDILMRGVVGPLPFGEHLRDADRYLIDNVAQMVNASGKDHWGIVKDFPCPRPPSDNMWMEWKDNGIDCTGKQVSEPARIGMHVITIIAAEEKTKTFLQMYPTLPENAYWAVVFLSFFQTHKNNRSIAGPVFSVLLDRQGNILSDVVVATLNGGKVDIKREDKWENEIITPLLALSFCNCKNIVTDVIRPVDAIAKNRAKANRPCLTFKVLSIQTAVNGLRISAGCSDIRKAMHICRGHFAVYDERPLFGKYKGRFWVPQHVKGSSQEGVVVKEYSV
jgi:hypothetical protein